MTTPFSRSVTVFISRHLTPAERAGVLARYARRQVAELIRSGAASPSYDRYVDGREGVPEESVKAEGRIVYEFNRLGAVVVFALAFLRARSPFGPGDGKHYRDSFYVGVNGRFIRLESFRPELVPADAEIVIGNRRPYSRRVDVQLDGTRRLRFTVPPGLFDDAVRAIKAQYGRQVTAKRVYSMAFPGAYVLQTGTRQGKQVQSPALIISRR